MTWYHMTPKNDLDGKLDLRPRGVAEDVALMAAGRRADRPVAVANDYGPNLAIVLAAILVGRILVTIVRQARVRTDLGA